MQAPILEIVQLLKKEKIQINNKSLNEILKNFSFLHVSENLIIQEENNNIVQNIKDSKLLVFDKTDDGNYWIICFKNTIIITNQSNLFYLNELFSQNLNLKICYLSQIKETSSDKNPYLLQFKETICKSDEIQAFEAHFSLQNSLKSSINKEWCKIKKCISAFLIKQSYLSISNSRINDFYKNKDEPIKEKDINEDDCITLRNIGIGSVFRVDLIYHINKGKLYAKKVQHIPSSEMLKLFFREINNYMNMKHPFLPMFYCSNEVKHYYIIEFINGKTLSNINELNLTENEKMTILFELMITIDYLHHKKYVIRDLKPNNVMIDENKTAVIIDFDRMINLNDISDNQIFTSDFQSYYTANELKEGNFSYEKCDVYSFGMLLCYIMTEKVPNDPESIKYHDLSDMCKMCIDKIPEKRPTLSNLIIEFFINHYNQIQFKNYFEIDEDYLNSIYEKETIQTMKNLVQNPNDPETQLGLGFIYSQGKYVRKDLNKAFKYFELAANQNLDCAKLIFNIISSQNLYVINDINKAINYLIPIADHDNVFAQFVIGRVYTDAQYVSPDFNKAFHYLSLAANQGEIEAQLYLGDIFINRIFGIRDVNKAIYYYGLAANQNNADALSYLGDIYFHKEFGIQDVNKGLSYYNQAANLKSVIALHQLGNIYYAGLNVKRDINKAIEYYTLASNLNSATSQCQLGMIYEKGVFIEKDMKKAIYYYTLAADQNSSIAQYQLGLIYEEGQYVKLDLQKAIHYYELASKFNMDAQFHLGRIYHLIEIDYNKAIYYYKLAVNQNHQQAQFNLASIYYNIRDYQNAIYYYQLSATQNNCFAQYNIGVMYLEGIYTKKDVNKAIKYFELSANQNFVESIFKLFTIYAEGNDVPQNINKAVNYLELASKLNDPRAQFNLGFMYHEGRLTTRDINKAIYYYNLAANQNYCYAIYNLAVLYFEGKYVEKDINKAFNYLKKIDFDKNAQYILGIIYSRRQFGKFNINEAIRYYTLSANQNYPQAQYFLSEIYSKSQYGKIDYDKSIYYLTRSSNLNFREAQFKLGLYYYEGKHVQRNINKGILLMTLSAKQLHVDANFVLGFLYQEGKYINRDMDKAIGFYKEASSFNNQYAKNNLGFIYRKKNNLSYSIELFKEAIRQNNDVLASYNLANIYFYTEIIQDQINKSIDLLIFPSKCNFYPAQLLLSIILIKKVGYDIEEIKKEINKNVKLIDVSTIIIEVIQSITLNTDSQYDFYFTELNRIYFLYNYLCDPIESFHLYERRQSNKLNLKDINSEFYKGFDIYL